MGTNVGIIDLGLSINKRMFNKQLSRIAGSAKSSVMSAFKPLGKMIGTALGTAARRRIYEILSFLRLRP